MDLPSSPSSSPPIPADRALVIGGGGSVGNAWSVGVLAGLVEAGLDVLSADLVVGTSSGATAAAQVTAAAPADLLAAIRSAPVPAGGPRPRPAVDHQERTRLIIEGSTGPADLRRRLGAAALEIDAATDGSGTQWWRQTTASRLPSAQWPDRRLLITAVDARTGAPVILDRHSGVDLVDAVGASTSSGPPYRVGEDRYLDGGYRRNENADLATGFARVLVLSPLGGRTRTPLTWRMHLDAQVADLRAGGSRVETLLPDRAALDVFGTDLMDVSRRAPAAQAGYEQGRSRAEALAELWG
jgi:NTE family protein